MKSKTTITINLVFLLLAGVITKVTQYLIDIIIARTFGPQIFGVYSEYFTVLSLLILIADFGLNSFIIAKYHELKTANRFSLRSFILFKLLISCLTLAIIFVVGLLKFNAQPTSSIYYLLTFIFFLTTINNFIFFYFRAILKPVYEAFTRLVIFVFFVALLFAMKSFLSSVNSVLLFFVAINTLILFVNCIILIFKKEEDSLNSGSIKLILQSILPYGLSIVFVELYYYFDSLLLGLNFPPEVLGNYRAAYGIITMFSFLLTLVHHTLIPMYSRKKIDRGLTRLIGVLLFLASIGIVIVVFAFAETIIHTLYGKDFNSGVNALRILTFTVPLMWNYALYSIRLIAHGYQKELTKVTFTACLLNIVLNLLFSFRFSLYSASVITITTEATIFFLTYVLYKRKEKELNSSLVSE